MMGNRPLTFGSLFAGIGGFDLGFERAGMKCVWQVENDPYCQRVLAKNWPNVRRWDDVCTFPPKEGDWHADVICGGFPCQDISNAGKRAGIEGERSGLWREFARIIRVLRPRFIVVENVAALLVRGLDRVLCELAASGYDAEWRCFRASQFGAPHIRDRLFILGVRRIGDRSSPNLGNILADPGSESRWVQQPFGRQDQAEILAPVFDVPGDREASVYDKAALHTGVGAWASEPGSGRVVYGISGWMDRSRVLGNAVVPQVAEYIGKQLLSILQEKAVVT